MDHLDHLVLQDSQALPARQALLELRVLLERPEQPELLVHLVRPDHLVHLEQLELRVLQVLLVPLVQQGILGHLVRLGLREHPEQPELPELQVLLDLVFITSKTPRQRHHIMMVIDGMTPQRDWNLFG
jgi:hypothetical protein